MKIRSTENEIVHTQTFHETILSPVPFRLFTVTRQTRSHRYPRIYESFFPPRIIHINTIRIPRNDSFALGSTITHRTLDPIAIHTSKRSGVESLHGRTTFLPPSLHVETRRYIYREALLVARGVRAKTQRARQPRIDRCRLPGRKIETERERERGDTTFFPA